MPIYTATASYRYDNRERATPAPRGHLRMAMPADKAPDWTTLEVTGPEVETDGIGRPSFTYTGKVEGG